ncbi:MAG: SanA/YdcF family protein [Lentihominibacter sp.]|jgi:SanA protein
MIKLIKFAIKIIILACIVALCINAFVVLSSRDDIAAVFDDDEINAGEIKACKSIEPQCILVLGCAVWKGGEPSPMLKDRLDAAIALYNEGVAPKILLSGDNRAHNYNEPYCMLKYTLEQGIPKEDIFLDFAGFSTYESIYRAKEVFCVDRMIVVTQKYHLYRTLKTCEALEVEAKGVASDQRKYRGGRYRKLREVFARNKDFVKGILKPEPTYLGDEIPIDGDGSVTHIDLEP